MLQFNLQKDYDSLYIYMQYIRPFPSLSATCDDIRVGRKAGFILSLRIP